MHLSTPQLTDEARAFIPAAEALVAANPPGLPISDHKRRQLVEAMAMIDHALAASRPVQFTELVPTAVGYLVRDCEAHTRDAEVAAIVAGSRRVA